tara:strand:- start:1484 stop:1966 length:483 start_codon:yes stop_codon:yes gene_type:complete
MVKKIKTHLGEGYRIKQKGVFNLDKIYEEMHKWLIDNKYDFNETNHVHKKLDKGDEIVLTWEAEREVTDFIKFNLTIDFLLQEINPVSDNLVSGSAKITFQSHLNIDYKEKWSSSKFKDFLFSIYRKIFYKNVISKYAVKLTNEAKELHDITKEVLEFYR